MKTSEVIDRLNIMRDERIAKDARIVALEAELTDANNDIEKLFEIIDTRNKQLQKLEAELEKWRNWRPNDNDIEEWEKSGTLAGANLAKEAYRTWLIKAEAERDALARNNCTWTYDDVMSTWKTTCGNAFCLEYGKPSENEMNYCAYCGGRLIEVFDNNGEAKSKERNDDR